MRLGKYIVFEKKDASSLANPDPALLALFGIGADGLITRQQALELPVVSAAIRCISEAAASLDINVVRVAKDGTETIDQEHPAGELLRNQVNDWTSGFEFIRDLVGQALIADGGGLAWVNRVRGEIIEIVQDDPGRIAATRKDTGEITYKRRDLDVPAGDIIHLRSPFSRSPLTMAMRAATVAWHLENHALNLFMKGARPAGSLEIPNNLGDEALKKMKAGWQAAFGNSSQSGGTPILWGGAKFNQMTMNSTDAQFLENRRFQNLEMARAFRVPPGMIYDLERQTWTNGEQQGKEFLSYSLEPWLRSLEAALRRALFTDKERPEYRIVFDRDDLSRADLQTRAVAINSLIASETINPNTGRQWLGLEPYDGGEKYGNRNITVDTKPADKPRLVA